MAWTGGLAADKPARTPGEAIYRNQCSVCHGTDRSGSPPGFPSLVDVSKKLTDAQITATIHQGKGRMPTFPNLTDAQLTSLLEFMHQDPTASAGTQLASDKQEMASVAAESATNDPKGAAAYQEHCAICHGDHVEGILPSFPMLIGAGQRLSKQQVVTLVHQGKGRMPAFPKLQSEELDALLRYLRVSDSLQSAGSQKPQCSFTGYLKFLDPDQYPAIAPPWGTLNAIDLNTGNYLWKIPLGEYPSLAAKDMKNTGSENYGGPIVTAGSLIFIGATLYDCKFHAFNSKTGKLLWQTQLSYAGRANPATYMIDGKQYVVVATGGGKYQIAPAKGVYVAFSLP
jgi:mono/diheme cytochrome c family protein